ncbi:DEAD/DEAH box helicase [Chelatococcus sp. GCM10030263]|uniref:DEAD/DEAH box helicase n=1 Tax=Chelatococcus sp. GCM10030263 TaxID=3273387 RepID=UPI0036130321
MSFSELGLSDKVLQAVAASGYTTPTPIQEQAIPHVLQRRDVLGIAQTGTGKTAAFTLPMLTLLENGRARARMPRTLILEPTRELAAQVEESFIRYGVNHKLNVALIIGGVSFGDQDAKITRGVDVLIATPGRLLDHFERGKLLLTGIEVLVIDEADRMLDMGFIPDIERICRMVPFTRQTLFFSATMPPEIQRLVDTFLHNPARIEVARPASAATTITQRLVAAGSEAHDKRDVLRRLIRGATDLKNAIIFCNRKRDVAIVHRSLERHGFSVVALHGDMDQRSRTQALDSFRNNEVQLLVASDVAARGLDIPDVSHVFNFDVPHHPEDYVHRIGRTGRAGRSGYAAMLVTPGDQRSLSAIEALTGQPIEWEGEPLDPNAEEAPRHGRRGDRRSPGGGSRASGRGEGGRGGRRGASAPQPEARTSQREERPQEGALAEERKAPEADQRRGARGQGERSPAERSQGEASQERAPRKRPQPAPAEHERARPRHHRRDDEDDDRVVGLGDHVPAFLLRPVRLPKKASSED